MSTNWQIGDKIQTRWEIYKILKGGMGIVYAVYDHEHRAAYAAKTFQDEIFARNPQIAARFRKEALAWVNLDVHQNVTQARFVQNIEDKPFLFLEYVSGGDLGGWIDTPRLTEDLPQVLRFAIQFCDGMTHAFSKGIKAHRDIKPQNSLITQDNTLKVTDFGLAKIFDDADFGPTGELAANLQGLNVGLSRTGTSAGTCTHMAPEQFDDAKHVDVRADIYSFGVMLFQMLTGQLPFVGRTWKDFESLHKTQRPPTRCIQPDALRRVIETCLAKNPADRFADFSTVRKQFAAIYLRLTGEPAPQPAVGVELDAMQWYNKGMSLKLLNQPSEALTCFDRALELNPSLEMVWNDKGVLLGTLGRHEEEKSCYERALSINPRLAHAWGNKGFMLSEVYGRYEEAIPFFDHALELNPRLEEAWTSKGGCFLKLGRFEEAIAYFNRALKLNPRFAGAWSGKATALLMLGKWEEALACHDNAIEANPHAAEMWYRKGIALAGMGKWREALTCFEQALKINPRFSDAWEGKGTALSELGEPEEAIDCFDNAIEINPQNAVAWFHKGMALADLGRVRDSIKCCKEAARLGEPRATEMFQKMFQETFSALKIG